MQTDQAPSQENVDLEQLHISVEVTENAEKAEQPLYRETVLLAGMLGLFLGCLGVHNFIIHKRKRGIIQLALTIAGLGIIGVFAVIASIQGSGCEPNAYYTVPCDRYIVLPETINIINVVCFFALVMPSVIWGTLESFWMLVTAGKYPLKNDPNKPDEPRKPLHY